MDKALLIQDLCGFLLNDKRNDCIELINENYPFVDSLIQKRQYSRYQMCKVFIKDGFIDRYSGDKLLFPGLIKILTIEFPELFRYHLNWKMSETHMIYWELFPTIDHFIPIARGGLDEESNLVTTSMIHNSAKSNWTIDELGWTLYEKSDNWDGLARYFLDLTNKNLNYEKDNYVSSWKKGLLRAINDTSKK